MSIEMNVVCYVQNWILPMCLQLSRRGQIWMRECEEGLREKAYQQNGRVKRAYEGRVKISRPDTETTPLTSLF